MITKEDRAEIIKQLLMLNTKTFYSLLDIETAILLAMEKQQEEKQN